MSSTLPPGALARSLPPTARTTHKRRAQRGSHERAAIDAILDEALVCHLAVSLGDGPHVLPTAHVRVGDALYLHGARQNRLLCAARGVPACITVTLLDGFVFARTAFHHSLNYRSVVLFGSASEVEHEAEKRAALKALLEHVAPGRSAEAIAPTREDLDATLVLRFPIREGSAKMRAGPPNDPREQAGQGIWAGVLPLRLTAGTPEADDLDEQPPPLSRAVEARARALGASAAAHYERLCDGLLISTDPARLDRPLVHAFLCDQSYWARGVSRAAFDRACGGSLCFGMYRGRGQLAFARVVTDFARFAYLADVFVIPEQRGRGLSKLLLAEIFAHPELSGVQCWLLGTKDAHSLYARHGFVPTPEGRYMVRR